MIYKYGVFPIILIVTYIFCRAAFSDSMTVSPNSFILGIQDTGTVTVKILNNQGNPVKNAVVSAKSNKEDIATVTPKEGLTNTNGQTSFTISGRSHGTATITFTANTLSNSLPVTVVSNIAPCARASSSGGGVDTFGPEMMNDEKEKDDCSYHWIRTRNEKKNVWIQLDWDEEVTLTKMTIQTTDCKGRCGEDSNDPLYIDPGRNLGNGSVQYLDKDGITWITDKEFEKKTGDIEYSFTRSVTTKAIRIRKISPSVQCKGQQSNPVVFEWKVYGTPPCK